MRYYIIAPAQVASGGPELAHQMCNALNKYNVEAYMYYNGNSELAPQDVDESECYKKYKTTHVKSLEEVEREDSIVICNETSTSWLPALKKCKKILWWMSVDFYIINTNESDIEYLRDNVDFHLVQSHYAYDYVMNKVGVPKDKIIFVSDYINEEYGKFILPSMYRQNIGLYNPKKGYKEFEPLMEYTKDVRWVPIVNLKVEEVIVLMQSAKVYVDFGNHPGKDRIPREAASCGCCVITNKKGSAAYKEDVSIPNKYKFENVSENYEKIAKLIENICKDFDKYSADFNGYRKRIASEKSQFAKDVRNMHEMVKFKLFKKKPFA